ncbi:10135_t:CDS:2, partial [Gigaspora margarita]
KLIIGVDIAAKEAKVKLNHDIQHEKPVNVTTPEEIKCKIIYNLHIDLAQLRMHICQKFDTLQLDDDPFTSTHQFLDNPNNNSEFCYEWNDESVTAIGF